MIPQHHFHPSIVRAYDYRGVVEKTLFTTDAQALGRFFTATLQAENEGRKPVICVGYDGRLSSIALETALVRGLQEAGAEVIRIGLGPTPMLYFAVQSLKADGGIMITGSHNPPSYNGFKMTRARSPFLSDDLLQLAADAAAGKGTLTFDGAVSYYASLQSAYSRTLFEEFQRASGDNPLLAARFASLRVAWDCGNGAAGPCLRDLLDQLPGHHVVLNEAVDGRFPAHHPDPSDPKNLQELIEKVVTGQFDLGIAFDGDGDRIGIVDATGEIIWPDRLMAIFAQDVLARNPGATVIGDIKSSQVLFETIKTCGGEPLCVRTGHSYIKAAIKTSGALLAGEMSGHIFFNDHYYGYDDALYAGLRLLLLLAQHDGKAGDVLRALSDALPRWVNTPEVRVECDAAHNKFEIIERIKQSLVNLNESFLALDGVRYNDESGWWLVRASNTEDVLTSRCEAVDEQGLQKLEQHMKQHLLAAGVIWP